MEKKNLKQGRKGRVLTISLPESLAWKLSKLSKETGIPKSGLVVKGLLYLISELATFKFPGGEIGHDVTLDMIEKEYQNQRQEV